MGNVYLITGASSDVGCALIERLYQAVSYTHLTLPTIA